MAALVRSSSSSGNVVSQKGDVAGGMSADEMLERLTPVLIDRFRESEENVKLDVFNTFAGHVFFICNLPVWLLTGS